MANIIQYKKDIQTKNSADIFRVIQDIRKKESINFSTKEYFWVIALNDNRQIVSVESLKANNINKFSPNPVEIYNAPIRLRVGSVVIVHNKCSSIIKPSEQDKDMTNRLIQAGLILNITLNDHLIINNETYYSFADSGLLRKLYFDDKYALTFIREGQWKREVEKKVKEFETIRSKIMKEGELKGRLKGEKAGKEKERKRLARKLILSSKMSLRDISYVTDISYNWIIRLQRELIKNQNLSTPPQL